jgi:hypothetical protein
MPKRLRNHPLAAALKRVWSDLRPNTGNAEVLQGRRAAIVAGREFGASFEGSFRLFQLTKGVGLPSARRAGGSRSTAVLPLRLVGLVDPMLRSKAFDNCEAACAPNAQRGSTPAPRQWR